MTNQNDGEKRETKRIMGVLLPCPGARPSPHCGKDREGSSMFCPDCWAAVETLDSMVEVLGNTGAVLDSYEQEFPGRKK